jgi:hypothetical protein
VGVVPTRLTIRIVNMSSPAKRDAPPGTPAGSDADRIPGPLSSLRLEKFANRAPDSPAGSPVKRTIESPLESAANRKRKHKKKKSTTESSAKPAGDESGDESSAPVPEPKSRFEVPELRTKTGAIRPLGQQRIVPCYGCIRSITNDSFTKYPHRCYDVKHETRTGVNLQCATCARKHLPFCVPVCFGYVFLSFRADLFLDSC